MMRLFDRAASLAAEVVKIEPHFAPETAAVRDRLAGRSPLSPRLAELRKAATRACWDEGLAGWNLAAARRGAFLRRLPGDAALVSAVQDLFTADFGESHFRSGLDGAGALFVAPLRFAKATIEGDLRLDGAHALGPVAAEGLSVTGDLSAEGAQFAGPVDLTGLRIGRAARFSGADFHAGVGLNGAAVGRELWLRHARFGGALRMVGARIGRDASLGAVYDGPAHFMRSHFTDTVSFEGAAFKAAVALDGCRFDGVVLTRGASAVTQATVSGAVFRLGERPPAPWLRRGLSVREMVEAVQQAMTY